eukprot:7175351-Alexandrium_andersonii.AAC.1
MSAASTAPFPTIPCASLAAEAPAGCTKTMKSLPRPGSLRRSSRAAAVAVRGRSTRASSWRGSCRCAVQRRSQCRP